MKILLFHPWIKSRGGGERLIYEYTNRSKHDITLFTWYYVKNQSFNFKNIKYLMGYNFLIDKMYRTYFFRALISLFLILTKIFSSNYDIFLISTAGIAELCLLRKKKQKTVLYVHTPLRAATLHDYLFNIRYRFDNIFSKLIYKLAFYTYRKLEKLAWKNVDFAIFNSDLSLKRAIDKKLIEKEKAIIIYPGVNLDGFYNKKPEDYFLCVARIGVSKRQDVIIEAFKEIVKDHPTVKLILAGSLENRKYYLYLLKLIKKYKLEKRVIIKLNLSDREIKDLYAGCLAFIHIPFMEDFGIAPLEAMASGKFVISTIAGNYNLLKDAPGIIWLKDSINKKTIAKNLLSALREFLNNKEKFTNLGLKNKDFIKNKNISWEDFAKKMDETLETLFNK